MAGALHAGCGGKAVRAGGYRAGVVQRRGVTVGRIRHCDRRCDHELAFKSLLPAILDVSPARGAEENFRSPLRDLLGVGGQEKKKKESRY